MSDQNVLQKPFSRRDFLKTMSIAGATATFTSAIPSLALGKTLTKQADLSLDAQAGDILAKAGKDLLLRTYTRMSRSRIFETSIKDFRLLAQKDPMYGNWYPYIGQEAVAGGVICALKDDDFITVTHRSMGGAIAKGADLQKITDEIFFRTTGTNQGYGGTLHVTQKDVGMLGANGIVGGNWYTSAGAAFASLVDKSGRVSVAFAGDGATNSQYYFSAVRNSALYKLPAIFVIENNLYQSGAMYLDVSPVKKDLTDYTKGIGVPSIVVDGNDVAAVYAVTKAAVERARAGKGPTVIEAKTYRWYDHSGFAGAKAKVDGAFGLPYRSDAEVKQWMAKDPNKRFRAYLIKRKFATDAELKKIEENELAAVNEAIERAQKAPSPKPEMGLKYVYTGVSLPITQFYNGKGLATT